MKAKLILFALTLIVQQAANIYAQPQPGTQLWVYNAPAPISSSPAISSDGTIYAGTALGLCAITNAGSNKWTFATNVASSPAIGTDGTVYFGSADGNLYAVNPDGSQKWTYQFQGAVKSSPAIGLDNTVYVAATGPFASLFALSPDGTKKWDYIIGFSSSSPAIASDGSIYIAEWDTEKLYALNTDGSKKWEFALANNPADSPAIGPDGTVYITDGALYALDPGGNQLWMNSTNSFYGASPAIGKDGTIYTSARDLTLYAIKPSGQATWSAVPYGQNTNGITTPAIDSSGMIYYSISNSVFAITPQGSVQWVFVSADSPGTPPSGISPAIGPDGTIYACFGPHLYAIAGTNALGNTPWPMYRQNLRHTGKLEKPSLNQPKKRADAGFEFQMFGEVGQPYTIQSSTNLASWAAVTNFIASTQTTSVVDFTASNSPSRFYRALIQ